MSGVGTQKGELVAVAFIDHIWNRNRLLAAMCLNNTERFSDDVKLSGYIKSIERRVYLWGIGLPRLYVWLLPMFLIAVIWLIPDNVVISLADTTRRRLLISYSTAQVVGAVLTALLGVIAILAFSRLCTAGIQRLEIVTNERFIRPGIAMLRYIRNAAAERLLAELSARIVRDFSIGDTTRLTIQTGLVLPVRDEDELILMLAEPATRVQAMERLAELGSERAIAPLTGLLQQGELDRVAYANTIRSLVRIARAQFGHSQTKRTVETELLKVLENPDLTYNSRLDAYRGLVDLGVQNVQPPDRSAADTVGVIITQWQLFVPLLLFLGLGLLMYLAF
jgi:hypothetical protein